MVSERCSQCGGELEARAEGRVQGLFCKHCGWAVITSRFPAIEFDQTDYEIRAIGGDFLNKVHVKAVAEITGRNFLGARKLLQETEPLVYRGQAPEVARFAAVLTAAGLGVQIVPPFPHSVPKNPQPES